MLIELHWSRRLVANNIVINDIIRFHLGHLGSDYCHPPSPTTETRYEALGWRKKKRGTIWLWSVPSLWLFGPWRGGAQAEIGFWLQTRGQVCFQGVVLYFPIVHSYVLKRIIQAIRPTERCLYLLTIWNFPRWPSLFLYFRLYKLLWLCWLYLSNLGWLNCKLLSILSFIIITIIWTYPTLIINYFTITLTIKYRTCRFRT